MSTPALPSQRARPSSQFNFDTLGRRWVLASILVLYVTLAGTVAYTRIPTDDEGWFNAEAQEFRTTGRLAIPVLDTVGRTWVRVNEHNYMILPGYPMLVAAWFDVTGPGLLRSRAFSVFCGGLSLLALTVIVRRLLGSRAVAHATTALVGLDYIYLVTNANARMDPACLALGLGGIALYLTLRTRHLALAIFAGVLLTLASVMTHVNGVICFAVLVAWTDWRRLRLRHAAAALAAAAIVIVPYFLFILKDVEAYRLQFGTQSLNRVREIWKPVEIYLGLKEGIFDAFGGSGFANGRAIKYNVIALALYLFGLAVAALSPRIRAMRNMFGVFGMIAIAAGWLTIHRSTVSHLYLILLIPFLAIPLATCLVFWRETVIPYWGVWAAVVGLFVVVSVGGVANRILHNDYHRQFLATAEYLKQHSSQKQVVFASCEFAAPIGPLTNSWDDNLLGFYSGRRPDFIVMDVLYSTAVADWVPHPEIDKPRFQAYRAQLLSSQYREVYANPGYRVYQRLQ